MPSILLASLALADRALCRDLLDVELLLVSSIVVPAVLSSSSVAVPNIVVCCLLGFATAAAAGFR